MIKRIFDLTFSLILFIALIPVFALISVIIYIKSPGPIFYRGIRTGKGGKEFKIYKFRTMCINADTIGGGTTGKDDIRVTREGKILRKYKLDELPQLINVIKGEMSIVGPRPELVQYTQNYSDIEKIILTVKPGITDLSSLEFFSLDEVVGSKEPDFMYENYVLNNKNKLRIKYVNERTILLDLKIIFQTIVKIIKKIINEWK